MFCLSLLRKTLSNKPIIDIRQTSLFHVNAFRSTKVNNDIAELESLEQNLFENSSHSSSAVNSKTLLRQYNHKVANHGRDRRLRKKESAKPFQYDNKVNSSKVSIVDSPLVPKKASVKFTPELIIDEEIGFRYTKLQRNDTTLQKLMMAVKSKKDRGIKHQLLIEGRRLIVDTIKFGVPLKYLIFSDIDQLKLVAPFVPKDVTCYKVAQSDLSFWSTLTTCPGLIAIFEKPVDMSEIWKQNNYLPIIVVCDQVREPNNVGSIIRACASIPVEKVILTKGCADAWEAKALRGGAGAQFLVPTLGPMPWESIYSILPYSYKVFLAENNHETAKNFIRDEERFVPYTDVSFGEKCVVVIGGETEGVSREAYQLLNMNSNGSCVHIPLANGIDSLNTSTALAVLLFEIKKKMLKDLDVLKSETH